MIVGAHAADADWVAPTNKSSPAISPPRAFLIFIFVFIRFYLLRLLCDSARGALPMPRCLLRQMSGAAGTPCRCVSRSRASTCKTSFGEKHDAEFETIFSWKGKVAVNAGKPRGSTIPKGLCHSAQGREGRATLGSKPHGFQPQRGCGAFRARRASTPLGFTVGARPLGRFHGRIGKGIGKSLRVPADER